MNNLIKQRLVRVLKEKPVQVIVEENIPLKYEPVAIPPEEVKKIVLDFLNMPEQNTSESGIPAPAEQSFTFKGIEHFSDWYSQNMERFSEQQRIALGTVLQARQGINAGCSCRRNQRLRMAEDYYVHFFTQNAANDLISAIKLATGAQALIFYRGSELFLQV